MPRGRKSNLEHYPELAAKLCELVSAGTSLCHAIELVGLNESKVFYWLRQGEKPSAKPIYLKFRQAVKAARMEFVLHHLATIKRAGRTSWQASAWLLERSNWSEWATPAVRLGLDELRREISELNERLKVKGLPLVPAPTDFDLEGTIIHAEPIDPENDPAPIIP